jgi:hypothetical protein
MVELYDRDDVQEILHRAIARQTRSDELSRVQLIEIAGELGISPDDIRMAEQEWFTEKSELQERQIFHLHQRRELKHHVVKYGIVNSFLLLLNLFTSGGISWAIIVALGWGLGLSLHAWKVLHRESPEYEGKFQRWRRRKQLTRSVNRVLNRWLKA